MNNTRSIVQLGFGVVLGTGLGLGMLLGGCSKADDSDSASDSASAPAPAADSASASAETETEGGGGGEGGSVQTVAAESETVEAACGQCLFELEGDGCDLAVRIDGKAYYVDGTGLNDHGDAHGKDGFCNVVREATVTGKVVDGRFLVEAFTLVEE